MKKNQGWYSGYRNKDTSYNLIIFLISVVLSNFIYAQSAEAVTVNKVYYGIEINGVLCGYFLVAAGYGCSVVRSTAVM